MQLNSEVFEIKLKSLLTFEIIKSIKFSGCRTVIKELVAPVYFSACLRRSLFTKNVGAMKTCVVDRLTAAYKSYCFIMYAQVGDCLIDLIDGSGTLPYVEDTRYTRRRRMIEDLMPDDENAEIALQRKDKTDVLHRKCSEYPSINLYCSLML